MSRNSELIRQWHVLQEIGGGRGNTIARLASVLTVSTRTIRRDLAALQEAGFPIYDETVNGTKFWRLEHKSLGAIARSGLTFSELCALYFSRALIECFAGTHLLADVQSALDKFESALTPQMRKFLDRLPRVITAKAAHPKRRDTTTYQITSRLLEAILHQRTVAMRYHSHASHREKDYIVHPYRLIHAQGGLYLIAFVPAYAELRTFAVERIRRATVQQDAFNPVAEFDAEPFKNSIGAYRGSISKVQLKFHPRIAPYIHERLWHASQQLKDGADGSVTMALAVCDDYALRSWILSFGRLVRVLAPMHLADWAREELDCAARQYSVEEGDRVVDEREAQMGLPLFFERLASA
jgi:predicted DNA-binding transcriptional regulator YafY